MDSPNDPNRDNFGDVSSTPGFNAPPPQPPRSQPGFMPPPPPPPGGFHFPPPPPPHMGQGPMAPMGYRQPVKSRSTVWRVVGLLILIGVIGFNVLIFAGMFGGMAMLGGGGSSDPHRVVEYDRRAGVSKDKIAVVSISGVIMEEGEGGLFGGGHENPVQLLEDSLDRAAEDPYVKAVILEINSPGGGVTASDLMHHKITQFKSQTNKPIVVYMKDLAASGGYYISAPADVIVANPTTLTGSIGVIIQGLNFHGTLTEVVKAKDMTIKAGKNKGMGSPFADPTSEEAKEGNAILQELVDEMHGRFKKLVKEGRKNRLAADWETYADGRILSADKAKTLGFVDRIGYFDDAVEEAERLTGSRNAQVVEYGRKPSGLAALFGMNSDAKKPKVSLEDVPAATADALAARMQAMARFYPNRPLAIWVP
ncbi:MAG: signal peptide peptidase SppA [Planctomycetes bacterium]|nr:signal peptide peptidase SppA [Planctomycetota bacterium]